jgi:hypothetical protein
MGQETFLEVEYLAAGQIIGGVNGGAGTALASAGTINSSSRIAKINPAAAVTSCLIGSGLYDGQRLTVVNVAAAASSVAFAAVGSAAASSHVASGIVISGLGIAEFVWESTTALWYPLV